MAVRAAALTRQIRVRVARIEKPKRRHQPARRMDGSGGWAFEAVVWGMRVPVWKKSQAAGM
jgi:hypothetical protein